MHPLVPETLTRLRAEGLEPERDDAWTAFIAAHNRVVLRTCQSVTHDYDVAMDAYTHVLEALREDNCWRLRAYTPDGKTKFTTWLMVVTRRLALDHVRHRYGRSRGETESRRAEQASRRRLEDLLAEEIEPDQLPSTSSSEPDAGIRRVELINALRNAVSGLDPAERLLLVLRFVDERSVRDIARTLRLPSVFHVYRRLATVLARLRATLARQGVDNAEP